MGTVNQAVNTKNIHKALDHLADFAKNSCTKLDKTKITQVAQEKDSLYLSLINFNMNNELCYTIQLVVQKAEPAFVDVICVKVTPAGISFITDGKFKTLQTCTKDGLAEQFIAELVKCIESYA